MSDGSNEFEQQILSAVRFFENSRTQFGVDALNLQNRLLANENLKKLIHSSKWRTKELGSLKDKLRRREKNARDKEQSFDITGPKLFDEIVDLAGVRLLHLNMRQVEEIHPLLMTVFEEEEYIVCKAPEAKTWDHEYEQMFQRLGIAVERDESMYTSIHYVVKQNRTTRRQCEVQVRTLAEEVWGETSHAINYPHKTESVACAEQLKVLARIVSVSSRLVDAIAASHREYLDSKESAKKKAD